MPRSDTSFFQGGPMREHIKAFLLASSLAFGIPTFVDAEPLERGAGGGHEARARCRRERGGGGEHEADAEAKALADMAMMRAETLSRVAALLTPEQRAR